MHQSKNIRINGARKRPITLDIFFENEKPRPTIIYAHGFNGFKDWGNFDLIASQFVRAGFTFVKFNFSHNGTTPDAPEDFTDLQAYSENNYSLELADLQRVIDWTVADGNPHRAAILSDGIYLIGHSMGGGIVLVESARDRRVRAVATWASVGELTTPWGKWNDEKMRNWQKTGVEYITNSRTNQQMPLRYQLYEDFEQNRDELSVEHAVKALRVPLLLCHGTLDEAVPVETAHRLGVLNPLATVFTLETDHVFGRKHPWPHKHLPEATRMIVDKSIDFFRAVNGGAGR